MNRIKRVRVLFSHPDLKVVNDAKILQGQEKNVAILPHNVNHPVISTFIFGQIFNFFLIDMIFIK